MLRLVFCLISRMSGQCLPGARRGLLTTGRCTAEPGGQRTPLIRPGCWLQMLEMDFLHSIRTSNLHTLVSTHINLICFFNVIIRPNYVLRQEYTTRINNYYQTQPIICISQNGIFLLVKFHFSNNCLNLKFWFQRNFKNIIGIISNLHHAWKRDRQTVLSQVSQDCDG